MPVPEDHFTNTVEAAAAYERWRASHDYEDFDDGFDPPPADAWDDDELETTEQALAEHDAYESEPPHEEDPRAD